MQIHPLSTRPVVPRIPHAPCMCMRCTDTFPAGVLHAPRNTAVENATFLAVAEYKALVRDTLTSVHDQYGIDASLIKVRHTFVPIAVEMDVWNYASYNGAAADLAKSMSEKYGGVHIWFRAGVVSVYHDHVVPRHAARNIAMACAQRLVNWWTDTFHVAMRDVLWDAVLEYGDVTAAVFPAISVDISEHMCRYAMFHQTRVLGGM